MKHVGIDFHFIRDQYQNGAFMLLMCRQKINYQMFWQNHYNVITFFLSRPKLESPIGAPFWGSMLMFIFNLNISLYLLSINLE